MERYDILPSEFIGKCYETKKDVITPREIIKKGRVLYCYHATYNDGIWLKDESTDSLVVIIPFEDINFYVKEIKQEAEGMKNNKNFEIFELSCLKKFKRKVRQRQDAGANMTVKQKNDALKFIETSYVNACHKVNGELTWDERGNETYHRPFYVSPVDDEEGDFIELAPIEAVVE